LNEKANLMGILREVSKTKTRPQVKAALQNPAADKPGDCQWALRPQIYFFLTPITAVFYKPGEAVYRCFLLIISQDLDKLMFGNN
jgi:hypothetical protein